MSKRFKIGLGVFLIVCAVLLFGTIAAAIATPCEHPTWQAILITIGSFCTLAMGWRHIVDGLGLSKS